jgi:sodium/hydrogen antiporter
MAWSRLHVSEINVILIFFGLFMMLFMLTSKITQSTLHVGAANVAFLAGIIFGPQAAHIFDPMKWPSIDTFILEATRVVLIAQCFANGVELPKFYLSRHWRSLVWILGPAMIFGWLVCTCCVKLMVPSLDWRQTLACAACFNAIDPILAATALQTGSFYRRVPIHIRHLLRAEAGCNGITTTLVLDIATYLLRYRGSAKYVVIKSASLGLGYDIALSIALGAAIGFAARYMLWFFDDKGWVDRPAFLSLYLALAIFCAGIGSIIGTDDVLLAFVAGYCLDYDDKYQHYTKASKLSETIDLLLNLTYFVFIGSVVPWSSFNSIALNIKPWRLVVGTLLIFMFRRLPAFTFIKGLVPDLKNMREAAFYAHFGPIGGGAVFAALLIKGQLTPGSVRSAGESATNAETAKFLERLWAIITFVVVASSLIHGSSIALFAFGKKLNAFELNISMEDVYEREEEPPLTKVKTPEIWLDPPSDDDSARTPSPRRRTKLVTQAVETIMHDLEDGHRIVVEDASGMQVKTFTVRRPSPVRVAGSPTLSAVSNRRHSDASSESESSKTVSKQSFRLRRSSTEQIFSYKRRSTGDISNADKGKNVIR